MADVTTDNSGKAYIAELEPGWYVISETKAPLGYVATEAARTVEVKSTVPTVVTITNRAENNLQILKLDYFSRVPLQGATFRVERSNGTFIGTFRTDAAGKILVGNLKEDTYVVSEIAAPQGYQLDSEPQIVVLSGRHMRSVEFLDKPLSGIGILKTDAKTNAPLSGAVFTVDKPNGERIGKYTTDVAGEAIVVELEAGTYIVSEYTAPDGYILNETPQEDAAVRDGFANLKDSAEYDNLRSAAKCREQADLAVGIFASRLFSVLYGMTLKVGRIQSPTLAMLVKREDEIANFVKESFYTPTLDLSSFTASGEKLKDKTVADSIAAACNGQAVTIERVTKSVAPPKLYDLTSLQRDANKAFGFTAQQTLDYIQSLYEKKLTTYPRYPRTDAKFITADMKDTVLQIIGDVDFAPDVDRLVGSVSDHHAIIPTLESKTAGLSTMPSGEREVFELVRKRLIAAVSPKHVYEVVTVTLDCGDPSRAGNHTFTAKGKTVIEQGWKIAQNTPDTDEYNESADIGDLSALSKGQTFDSDTVIVK